MTYQIIELIANISLALSFLIAVIFGIIEVRLSKRDRHEKLTLEVIRSFQTREFAEISGQVTYQKSPANLQEFLALPINEKAKYIQFGQEMESLGMLVAEHLIDIDLVDKTLGTFVTSSWLKFKTLFEELRQQQSDPFFGEYFQWLAEYIDDRMQKEPREPFHVTHRPA